MTLHGKFWSGKNSYMQDVISNKLKFNGRNIHSCFNLRSVKFKFRFFFRSGRVVFILRWQCIFYIIIIIIIIKRILNPGTLFFEMNNKKTHNIRKETIFDLVQINFHGPLITQIKKLFIVSQSFKIKHEYI